jgi:HD-GYP domain-containing protein (c-di-GMP phosphodiesterase class II)
MNAQYSHSKYRGHDIELVANRKLAVADQLFELIHHHGCRVGRLTFLLCRELGAAEAWSRSIARASVHHDLGKLCVSPDPLLSVDVIADRDKGEIRKHTSLGEGLVRKIMAPLDPLVEIQASICRHHHERFDGSGYPDGLAGAEIPLPARIVAVTDVFDALTSNRPYRRATTQRDALQLIAEGAGWQFDPDLVEAFESLMTRSAGTDPCLDVRGAPETTEDRWLYQLAAATATSLAGAVNLGTRSILNPSLPLRAPM